MAAEEPSYTSNAIVSLEPPEALDSAGWGTYKPTFSRAESATVRDNFAELH